MQKVLEVRIEKDSEGRKFLQVTTEGHRILFAADTTYLDDKELWGVLTKILRSGILEEE